MTVKTRLAVLFVMACLLTAAFLLLHTDAAQPRPPIPAPVFKSVRAYWRTTPERIRAFDVIACETGGRYNTTARNGQYLGLWQMGSFARARYGHGQSAMAQCRAAYRYYRDAGWGALVVRMTAQDELIRDLVADYDRRRRHWWGRFLLYLLRRTT